jgi:predicted lipoprotein
MKTQPKLAIRVAAAAVALSACGIAAGTPMADAAVVSARHAPGDNRFTEMRVLAQVKRDAAWAAVERAWAQQARMDASQFADLRDLDQVKRDTAWKAVEHAGGG